MTGERWTSYESRLPGFKVLVVPEAEAWEYEAPSWVIDCIIHDHTQLVGALEALEIASKAIHAWNEGSQGLGSALGLDQAMRSVDVTLANIRPPEAPQA